MPNNIAHVLLNPFDDFKFCKCNTTIVHDILVFVTHFLDNVVQEVLLMSFDHVMLTKCTVI